MNITLPLSALIHRVPCDGAHDIKCVLCGAATWDEPGAEVPHKPDCLLAGKQRAPVNRDQIRELALQNGFTIKEGLTDLKEYVYEFAADLIATTELELARPEVPPTSVIFITAYDDKGRLVTQGTRSTSKPNDDLARMNVALEYHYAVRRGVQITPQQAFDHIVKDVPQPQAPEMTFVHREALLDLLRAVLGDDPGRLRELVDAHRGGAADTTIAHLLKDAHVRG